MALPTAYLTSTRNLEGILNAIRGAQAPDKFTQKFLESLEFKSSSDRLIINVLKALGFLDDGGRPTQRYFSYLDQGQSGRVLAEGIREAYADLFKVNVNAQKMSKSDVVNKLKTLSEEMARNADQTADEANSVSAAAEEVSVNLQSVAAGSDQLNASIREISQSSHEAARVATAAVKVAEDTNATVTKVTTISPVVWW